MNGDWSLDYGSDDVLLDCFRAHLVVVNARTVFD